jgi:hypothetical protein
MSYLKKSVLSIPCPECGAAKGTNCSPTGKHFGYPCCKRRWYARPLAKTQYLPVHDIDRGGDPCAFCANGGHSKCTGRHRGNHGVKGLLCTCQCEQARASRNKISQNRKV